MFTSFKCKKKNEVRQKKWGREKKNGLLLIWSGASGLWGGYD